MRSYHAITSQDDMNRLLDSIAGFHDSMTKEIHLVNRAFVRRDASMVMEHQYDAQVLIQSQWEPFAVELLFTGISELTLSEASEYWGATGTVELIANETQRITMLFDQDLKIVAEHLWYRVRREWLGQKAFLKSEVPSGDAIPARTVQEGWRQCSGCSDAWEESMEVEFSYCPGCERLTELVDDAR